MGVAGLAQVTREHSDSLFARGVELHAQGKYAQAIPVFTECDSIDRILKYREGYAGIWQASCMYHAGDTIGASRLSVHYAFTPPDRRLTLVSDSLSSKGDEEYKNQDYVKAAEWYRQGLDRQRKELGAGHPITVNPMFLLARTAAHLGDTLTCRRYLADMEEVLLNARADDAKEAYKVMEGVAGTFYGDSLYAQGIEIFEHLIPKEKEMGLDVTELRLMVAYGCAQILETENDPGKMRPWADKGLAAMEGMSLEGPGMRDFYLYLQNSKTASYVQECHTLMQQKKFDEAEKKILSALQLTADGYGEESGEYGSILDILALLYSWSKDVDKEIECRKRIKDLNRRIYGEESREYINSVMVLSNAEQRSDRLMEARDDAEEGLRLCKQTMGEKSPIYIDGLHNAALVYAKMGEEDRALRMIDEAIGLNARLDSVDIDQKCRILKGKGQIYNMIGRHTEAVNIHRGVIEMLNNLPVAGDNGSGVLWRGMLLFNAYSSLAQAYLETGEYPDALKSVDTALGIYREYGLADLNEYWSLIDMAASLNRLIGNTTEALRIVDELLDDIAARKGRFSNEYVSALNQKGMILDVVCQENHGRSVEQLIATGEEVVRIAESVMGKEWHQYHNFLNNLALYYGRAHNFDKSVALQREACERGEKVSGSMPASLCTLYHNLFTFLGRAGEYEEAIKMGEKTLAMRRQFVGKSHSLYILGLSNLIAIYGMADTEHHNSKYVEKIREYVPELHALIAQNVREQFTGLSSYERSCYWKLVDADIDRIQEMIARYATPSMASTGYNTALLSKGLLLNSDRAFTDMLKASGDSASLHEFERIAQLRRQAATLRTLPAEQRIVDPDSLDREAIHAERMLVDHSKEYGDFTHNLLIDWKEVRERLAPDDVAVEFVAYKPKQRSDTVQYIAYAIDAKSVNPAIVKLFDSARLKEVKSRHYYTTDSISRMVWTPLSPYFKDKKRIWFAPAGELYNIAIESVPSDVISGKELHRLSSTRELAVMRDAAARKSAVLYGGLAYDKADTAITDSISRAGSATADSYNSRAIEFSEDGGWRDVRGVPKSPAYLPATLAEATAIDATLRGDGYDSRLFTADKGTEESFKSLSGSRTAVMHVATHGFFSHESQKGRDEAVGLSSGSSDGEGRSYQEDTSMTRSGLLMSGAARTFADGRLPEGEEDGILTAQEIAGMDLSGLDLVVLSACQTGLGEIRGDGVFGLQRGFKKAGARSILMSLWKVDDNATAMLMTRFYDALASGKSKYESLREAQTAVREFTRTDRQGHIEMPFAHPRYWAAFILLDAI